MKNKLLLITLLVLIAVGTFHNKKELPAQVSYESPVYQTNSEDLHFLKDITYVDAEGVRTSEQEIFDEIFRMIDEANEYILIDLFLYNDFTGTEASSYRELSSELTEKILQKKKDFPSITIQIITDPVNELYGGMISSQLEKIRSSGIPVTVTDLRPLRDSNPIYSAFWRTGFQWFGNSTKEGWLPNPLDEESPKLGIRTYLKILNYKANHRKVVLADYEKDDGTVGLSTLITSANPHDGSSMHSNIAIRADKGVWQDIMKTESAVVEFSGGEFIYPDETLLQQIVEDSEGNLKTQILTEGKIKERAIKEIDSTKASDTIDMAMFYISDRDIVKALEQADQRGVQSRLLFDPNKDAFGREKNGMPNRQVANELIKNSSGNTIVRWCDTHGEQCHSKLLLITKENETIMLQGSGNFTKRNLHDYNLETNIIVSGNSDEQIFLDVSNFFKTQWNNEEGKFYSAPYETYQDESIYKTYVYMIKEFTGLSRW